MSLDANSAQVVIKREWGWADVSANSLIPWTVRLDGVKVGSLHAGRFLNILASPGQHDIVVSPHVSLASEPFRFNAKAGDRIDLVTRASAMSMRPKLWSRSVEPVTAVPKSPTPTTTTIVEGSHYEVPLGEETRTIDNSKSSSSTIRVVRLAREWVRTCALDVERNMKVRGSAGLRIHVLDLKAEAERTLTSTYSVTSEKRETFTEEVTLNIAQHTKSEVTFFWKEILQKGVMQIIGADFEVQIPYEVAVGLTFDQQQVDAS